MEICNHVHQIRIDFNVTEDVKRYVYVYLLTGSSCFLIDAGVAGASREIGNYMESIGRRLEEIEGIFLTHSIRSYWRRVRNPGTGPLHDLRRRKGARLDGRYRPSVCRTPDS